MMYLVQRWRFAIICWLAVVGALTLTTVPANAAAEPRTFEIAAGDAANTLPEFGRQAKLQTLFNYRLVRKLQTQAVSGDFEPEDALTRMLVGTGLTFERINRRTVAIRSVGDVSAEGHSDGGPAEKSLSTSRASTAAAADGNVRMAQAEQRVSQDFAQQTRDASAEESSAVELGEVVVTGTHIRGVHPDSSALIIIDQGQIARSGVTTVDQLLRQVPQNFSALDQETFLGNTGDEQVGANGTRGATVDLRGLGVGATLILVNGHRIAPSGGFGAFVDVSSIPLSAIDRVEILADGASALYGADAVAGVVNFVLKRDFSGAETSVRYGKTATPDLEERQFSQSLGRSWSSGNAMIVYEYYDQDELLASDRDYIPDQGGKFAVIPSQDRHSVYATIRRDFGPGLEISADGFYSDRDFQQDSTVFGFLLTEESGGAEAYGGAVTVSKELPADWAVKFTGNYAATRELRKSFVPLFPPANIDKTNAEVFAGDVRADGPLWAISGGDIRASVGLDAREDRFGDDDGDFSRWVRSAYGELFVPLIGANNAAALAQRLELSLAGRYDDYEDVGSSFNPRAGVLWEPVTGLKLRGTYATSFRAPPLSQLRTDNDLYFVLGIDDPQGASIITLVNASIGTEDLEPEESRSFTAGVDFTPSQLPGFTTSVTYFNVEFDGRIAQPPALSLFTIYSQTDVLAPFLDFSPDLAEVTRIFAEERLLNFAVDANGDPVGPEAVEVSYDSRLKNLAKTKTSGLDLLVNYEQPLGQNQLNLFGSATYLFEKSDQAASTTPEVDVVDKIYNPPRVRARGGGTWTRGSFSSTLTVNYTDSYQNDLVTPADGISSWTTFDAQIAWRVRDDDAAPFLRGLSVNLDILNLTDARPPSVSGGNNINLGFDPTNASPRGRFIALQIGKRW